MSDPVTDPESYDDTGGIPWDAPLLTINGKDGWIAEEWQYTEGSNTNVSNNQKAAVRGAKHMATLGTGSATLQFPTGATKADTPKRYQTFEGEDNQGVAKTFVLTKVGKARKSGQETKVSVEFAEVKNAD